MEKLYTIKEVASLLGVTTQTIHNYRKSGHLNALKIGKGSVRIAESEIKRLIGGE
jgi:excisionase family DNA binding protein